MTAQLECSGSECVHAHIMSLAHQMVVQLQQAQSGQLSCFYPIPQTCTLPGFHLVCHMENLGTSSVQLESVYKIYPSLVPFVVHYIELALVHADEKRLLNSCEYVTTKSHHMQQST